ncbi:hypothetical protein [Mycobacterium paraseoulense]|uniref:hypothetical protein n=1 Tax=Mycobacterium paraseoulense TaxID=590652 RepID=UPI001150E3D4|nr:hypothetical protein [Mycobacterium paraseoulense]MCV7393656.1 hypothetical protein [Mycobacterium paraseoulense]
MNPMAAPSTQLVSMGAGGPLRQPVPAKSTWKNSYRVRIRRQQFPGFLLPGRWPRFTASVIGRLSINASNFQPGQADRDGAVVRQQ